MPIDVLPVVLILPLDVTVVVPLSPPEPPLPAVPLPKTISIDAPCPPHYLD